MSELILIRVQYVCPCEAEEAYSTQETISLDSGEQAFIEASRRLYAKTVQEIKKHKGHETKSREPFRKNIKEG